MLLILMFGAQLNGEFFVVVEVELPLANLIGLELGFNFLEKVDGFLLLSCIAAQLLKSLLMFLLILAQSCGGLEELVEFKVIHACDGVNTALLDDVVGVSVWYS